MAQVQGTAGNDTGLDGTVDDDVIRGLEGNDSIRGFAGNDIIYGNQGDDLIYGNQGNDIIFGGQGVDVLFGGQGDDVVYGNLGNDIAYGNFGNDTLFGGQGDDILYGGQGDDLLIGGVGNDTLIGGLGTDTARFIGGPEGFVVTRGENDSVIAVNRTTGARTTLLGVEILDFGGTPVETRTIEVPGPTITVPGPTQFIERPDVIVSRANVTIDGTGQDPLNGNSGSPGAFFPVGSGNPATTVASVRNETREIELAVDYVPRQGSNVVDYTITRRADGSFDAYLPEGNQRSVQDGGDSQSTVANRAAFSRNIIFNADTDTDDTIVKTMADYDARIIIGGTETGTFQKVQLGAGNTPFVLDGTSTTNGFGDDDAGNGPRGAQTHVYSQSLNNGFQNVHDLVYGTGTPTTQFGAVETTFTMQFLEKGTENVVASLTVHEHVGMQAPAA